MLLRDDLLGGGHGERAVGRDPRGERPCAVERPARLGQGVDEAQAVGVRRGQRVASERQFHGDAGRDAARQPDQTPRACDQTALDLRDAELGIVRRDDQVTGQCHLAAARQRPAFHGGDQRLARRGLRDPGEAPALDTDVLPGEERLQVHPRAERASRPGDDAHGQVVPPVELVKRLRHESRHRVIDRVPRLRPVDCHDRDPVGILD